MNTIKIMHFADTHFGIEKYGKIDPETGMNSRLQDFRQSLEYAIHRALEENIDAALFAGDAYKNRDPSQTHQREFASCIRMLTEAGILVVMLTGNHDLPNTRSRANSIEIYKTLGITNVTIISKPETVMLQTKSGLLQVSGIPYLLRSNVLQKEEQKNKSIIEITDLMVSKYCEYIEYLADNLDPSIPAVLMGHFWIKNATVNSKNSYLNTSEPEVLLSNAANTAFDYVAMGHIHKYQNLNINGFPPVIYSGSTDRIDIGEAEEDKGFVIADISKGCCDYNFITIPTRNFIDIEIDADCDEPTEKIIEEIAKHNIKDAVIKIRYKISQEKLSLIREQEIRAALSEAFIIISITREVTTEKSIIRNKLLNEAIEPSQALEMYINTKESLKERLDELMRYAKPMIDELITEESML